MTDRTFTLPELASLVGVEYRTLHTWVRRGLLRASKQEAQGSGTRNLFDCSDALETWVLADLRRAGVELTKLQQVAGALRESRAEREPDAKLLINGRVSLCADDGSCLQQALSHSSPTLVYDLAHAAERVERRIQLAG